MAENARRRWCQFDLRSIFWIVLLVAVAFSAHRRGYDSGYASGVNHRRWVGTVYAKAYDIADLVPPKPAHFFLWGGDDLTYEIISNVLPQTWAETGGAANLAIYQHNLTLVVSHDQDGHEQVADFLERKRAQRKLAKR